MLVAGPRHLHVILDQFAAHYNEHRPHRARNLRPPGANEIVPAVIADLATAEIRRRRVLGGLVNDLRRAPSRHQLTRENQVSCTRRARGTH